MDARHAKLFGNVAKAAGYSDAEITAALCHHRRRNRLENPPGAFDAAGRFHADERTETVRAARTPSRSWPHSQMTAARSAAHCAEVHGAKPLNVKRLARALATWTPPAGLHSAHAVLAEMQVVAGLIKPPA